VHEVAESDELEELDQSPVRAVELEPTPAARDLQSNERIHGSQIGRHQPRHIQVHHAVTVLLLVVRHVLSACRPHVPLQ
jgi:hypothetical protein